jgi:hypothetical protein
VPCRTHPGKAYDTRRSGPQSWGGRCKEIIKVFTHARNRNVGQSVCSGAMETAIRTSKIILMSTCPSETLVREKYSAKIEKRIISFIEVQ